ncbi:MAG: hypothetical protein M0Q43_01410 [Methanothrix sp.]|jgi:hypothetical protein|nr:hypothetical protein [Methanothrix sp.]
MSILVGITLTAVGVALLNKMLKRNIWQPTNSIKWDRESKGQIIDIDEYEIVDEIQNRASEGYKVKIDDGDK